MYKYDNRSCRWKCRNVDIVNVAEKDLPANCIKGVRPIPRKHILHSSDLRFSSVLALYFVDAEFATPKQTLDAPQSVEVEL